MDLSDIMIKMNSKHIFSGSCSGKLPGIVFVLGYILLYLCIPVQARAGGQQQDTLPPGRPLTLPAERAEVILPRPALQPVKSFVPTKAQPIDTLDTQVWYIKVILYGDNTWLYAKDPDYIKDSSIYTDYWDAVAVDPYKIGGIKGWICH